jgi:hypothetical protein
VVGEKAVRVLALPLAIAPLLCSACTYSRTVAASDARVGQSLHVRSDIPMVLLLTDRDGVSRECRAWGLSGRVGQRDEGTLTLHRVRVTEAPRDTPAHCMRGDSARLVLPAEHTLRARSATSAIPPLVGLGLIVVVFGPPLVWGIRALFGG